MTASKNEKSTLSMWWLLIPAIIASAIVLGMYFCKFHKGLSNEQSVWGTFGDFFGGILNPFISVIAIIGAWFAYKTQIDANAKATQQFEIQNTISSFYSMLDLHLKKVDSFSTIVGDGELTGRNAMKVVLNEYKTFNEQSLYQISKIEIVDTGIRGEYSSSQHQLFLDVAEYENITNNRFNKQSTEEQINASLMQMGREEREQYIAGIYANSKKETINNLLMCVSKSMDDRATLENFKNIDNEIYHHYGNEIGHYIRNIAQIMKFISKVKSERKDEALQTELRRVFRAQLSRFELAIIAYNCLGNRTTREFNDLVSGLKILDELYSNDLYFDREYKSLFALRNAEF